MTDLDTWLGEPEDPQPHRQSVLFTKVVVALLSGRSAKHVLDVQRAVHVRAMKALTTARPGWSVRIRATARLVSTSSQETYL